MMRILIIMGNQRDREALSMCQYIYFGIFWRLVLKLFTCSPNDISVTINVFPKFLYMGPLGCFLKVLLVFPPRALRISPKVNGRQGIPSYCNLTIYAIFFVKYIGKKCHSLLISCIRWICKLVRGWGAHEPHSNCCTLEHGCLDYITSQRSVLLKVGGFCAVGDGCCSV